MFDEYLESLTEQTDLIILPEMFSTGFSMDSKTLAESVHGLTVAWMKQKAREKNAVICGSVIISDHDKFYNRLVWMTPEGEYHTYDKRHLFRMGEEEKNYSRGKKKLIVQLKGWNICPMVCYDLRFPVWSSNKNLEYDLLLYVANWPDRRSYAWKNLLIGRAIENQSYVIGLNRVGEDGKGVEHSGYSCVVDFMGQPDYLPPNKTNIKSFTLDYNALQEFRINFPAHLDADDFLLM